jgi:N-acetylmuramoyl-L-alanine amidase
MLKKIFILATGFTLLFMALISVSATTDAGKIRYTSAMGKRYVYLRDVARNYDMRCYAWQDRVVLYNDKFKLTFFPQSKYAIVNGIKISLLFAAYSSGSNAFINDKDYLLTIEPLIRSGALKKHRMGLIMLDPGHGGTDNGCKGRILREKDLILKISMQLVESLRRRGFMVAMTRTSDRFIELADRMELCRRVNADMYVSIHGNSALNPVINGIETYCLAPYGTASTNAGRVVESQEPGNRFDANNMALAFEIQQELIKHTKAFDRGVKRARFYVLKNAPCPAALIECGFLSNGAEEIKLSTPWYQAQLVAGITDGITAYSRMVSGK